MQQSSTGGINSHAVSSAAHVAPHMLHPVPFLSTLAGKILAGVLVGIIVAIVGAGIVSAVHAGAPPDDASFSLNVSMQATGVSGGSLSRQLNITNGSVCSSAGNTQSFTDNSTTVNTGAPYTETITTTCSGTYQGGQISYTETVTSGSASFQLNGVAVNCTLSSPATWLQLTGTYVGNNTFSGTASQPQVLFTCNQSGASFWNVSVNGTWTGTIVT